MVEGPQSNIIVYVAAIFFSLFVGQWVLDFFAFRSDWCVEEQISCMRDWISATSGWAAALAAAVTIYVLLKQLHVSREALKAQQRRDLRETYNGVHGILNFAKLVKADTKRTLAVLPAKDSALVVPPALSEPWVGTLFEAVEPQATYNARLFLMGLRQKIATYDDFQKEAVERNPPPRPRRTRDIRSLLKHVADNAGSTIEHCEQELRALRKEMNDAP